MGVNDPYAFPVPHPTGTPFNQKPTVPFTPWTQDPGYVAAQNAQQQRDAQAAAFWNQQRQAAQYRFGGAGNPYSTTALLKQQDQLNTRGYMNDLAAKGILSSGETGYRAGQEAKWYGQKMYDAQNALNDLLGGYQQQYLNTLGTDADAVNAALNTAWTNYLSNPDLYPRPPAPGAWTGASGIGGNHASAGIGARPSYFGGQATPPPRYNPGPSAFARGLLR